MKQQSCCSSNSFPHPPTSSKLERAPQVAAGPRKSRSAPTIKPLRFSSTHTSHFSSRRSRLKLRFFSDKHFISPVPLSPQSHQIWYAVEADFADNLPHPAALPLQIFSPPHPASHLLHLGLLELSLFKCNSPTSWEQLVKSLPPPLTTANIEVIAEVHFEVVVVETTSSEAARNPSRSCSPSNRLSTGLDHGDLEFWELLPIEISWFLLPIAYQLRSRFQIFCCIDEVSPVETTHY